MSIEEAIEVLDMKASHSHMITVRNGESKMSKENKQSEFADCLISKQVAIDAQEAYMADHPLNGYEDELALIDILRNLPSAQPQRWIPVTERLPEENLCTGYGRQYSESVLITAHNMIDDEDIVDYGHTVDGRWFSDTTDAYIPDNWIVTAWQKLPEPYKGE